VGDHILKVAVDEYNFIQLYSDVLTDQ
jgi:hypothetical protein